MWSKGLRLYSDTASTHVEFHKVSGEDLLQTELGRWRGADICFAIMSKADWGARLRARNELAAALGALSDEAKDEAAGSAAIEGALRAVFGPAGAHSSDA